MVRRVRRVARGPSMIVRRREFKSPLGHMVELLIRALAATLVVSYTKMQVSDVGVHPSDTRAVHTSLSCQVGR